MVSEYQLQWTKSFAPLFLIITFQVEGIPILASFLRKNHRALRLSTLQCLDVMVKNYGMSKFLITFIIIIE